MNTLNNANTTKSEETAMIITTVLENSCNTTNKNGGFGIEISCNFASKTREICKSASNTTQNIMILEAFKKAFGVTKIDSRFQYEFVTSNKYLIQTLLNKEKNLDKNLGGIANYLVIGEVYKAVAALGLEPKVTGTKGLSDGDVVLSSSNVSVVYKNTKGTRAEKLALGVRKLLDQTGQERQFDKTKGVVVAPKAAVEAPKIVAEATTPATEVITQVSGQEVEPKAPKYDKESMLNMLDSLATIKLNTFVAKDAAEVEMPSNIDAWMLEAQDCNQLEGACEAFPMFRAHKCKVDYSEFEGLLGCVMQERENLLGEGENLPYYTAAIVKLGRWLPSLKLERELMKNTLDIQAATTVSHHSSRQVNQISAAEALNIASSPMVVTEAVVESISTVPELISVLHDSVLLELRIGEYHSVDLLNDGIIATVLPLKDCDQLLINLEPKVRELIKNTLKEEGIIIQPKPPAAEVVIQEAKTQEEPVPAEVVIQEAKTQSMAESIIGSSLSAVKTSTVVLDNLQYTLSDLYVAGDECIDVNDVAAKNLLKEVENAGVEAEVAEVCRSLEYHLSTGCDQFEAEYVNTTSLTPVALEIYSRIVKPLEDKYVDIKRYTKKYDYMFLNSEESETSFTPLSDKEIISAVLSKVAGWCGEDFVYDISE